MKYESEFHTKLSMEYYCICEEVSFMLMQILFSLHKIQSKSKLSPLFSFLLLPPKAKRFVMLLWLHQSLGKRGTVIPSGWELYEIGKAVPVLLNNTMSSKIKLPAKVYIESWRTDQTEGKKGWRKKAKNHTQIVARTPLGNLALYLLWISSSMLLLLAKHLTNIAAAVPPSISSCFIKKFLAA